MAEAALTLFGVPRLTYAGQPVLIQRRKSVAVLAYLAVTGQAQSRDTLAALLWPEADQQRARASLRQALWALENSQLGPWLRADRDSVELLRSNGLTIDVVAFAHLIDVAQADAGPPAGPAHEAALEQALALYNDTFMAGFAIRASLPFESWQLEQAAALRRSSIWALDQLSQRYADTGQIARALEIARRWGALDPLDEQAHRQIMRLYAASGDRAAALQQYELCFQLLASEIGVEPDPETTALYQALRLDPNGASGAAGPVRRGRALPEPPTPFIGRAVELRAIEQQLCAAPPCRLLTLSGPGGIGKTRLALAAAQRLRERFRFGVAFVELAAVRSADMLAATIAGALDLSLGGPSEIAAQLADYLAEKELLLVLDNLEHLLDGAALFQQLLARAPQLRLLVTSRERLNLAGEWLIEVAGLSLPRPLGDEPLDANSATQLFLQSARRVRPGFVPSPAERQAIGQICHSLGGVPLAIELAAGWSHLLHCAEIAELAAQGGDSLITTRRDTPERHRSLRAVFEHSWRLLDAEAQSAFAGMTVFHAGFTSAAAAAVLGPERAVLDSLAALASKSLLRRSPSGRFDLHALLHQYAAEQLAQDPPWQRRARERHGEYYSAMLGRLSTQLDGPRQAAALDEIAAEIENVRAAWQWASELSHTAALTQSLDSLWLFYETRSWFAEGAWAFERAAEGPGLADQLRGRLLARTARLVQQLGDYDRALKQLARSQALLTDGPSGELALVLALQGDIARGLASYDEADGYLRRSLDMLGAPSGLPGSWAQTLALNGLGVAAYDRGRYAAASGHFAESLALGQRRGDPLVIALAENSLGIVAYAQGHYQEARRLFERARLGFRACGDLYRASLAMNNLGVSANALGDHALARQYYRESLAIKRELGSRHGIAMALNNLGSIDRVLGQHSDAAAQLAEGLAIAQAIGDRGVAARLLNNLGLVAMARGEPSAEQHFRQGLGLASAAGRLPLVLDLLLGLAELRQQQSAVAVAYGLLWVVLNHPASEAELCARARAQIAAVEPLLSPEERASAQARPATEQLEALMAGTSDE